LLHITDIERSSHAVCLLSHRGHLESLLGASFNGLLPFLLEKKKDFPPLGKSLRHKFKGADPSPSQSFSLSVNFYGDPHRRLLPSGSPPEGL
jgi:hypothetical protein